MKNRGSFRRKKSFVRRGDRKVRCIFCKKGASEIKFSNAPLLLKYLSERCKIKPRYISGNCHRHQTKIESEIAIAKELAFVPYAKTLVVNRLSDKRDRTQHVAAVAPKTTAH